MMHRVHEVVPLALASPGHVPRWVEKFVARKAHDIICVSPIVEEFVRGRSGRGRCHLVPNAIAPCFFEVQKSTSAAPGMSLLFVGTVYPLKGLLQLVEALPAINDTLGQPVLLRVVGQFSPQDSYNQQVRQRARELGVEPSIEWLGVLYEQEIADILSRTDVLVLPSFEESYGMCLAEAMAAGVPVIASRVGGVPYVVDDGVNGLLVNPGKPDELAQASIKLLKDVDLRQRMGGAGRAKAQAHYTPRAVADKLWSVYEHIAHENR